MDPTIKKILNQTRDEGVFHTHVSMIKPYGKHMFNRQILEEFWEAYCDVIELEDNPVLGIAEKPQPYLPVIVDIDLRIRDEGNLSSGEFSDALYTDEQLKSVVETYQSTLRQIVDACTEEDLTCVVLEKDMYQQTKNEITYLKHGFHLHFPYIFLSKVDQEIQLIPRIQEAIQEMKLFENLGLEDSGKVVDNVCSKPWLLYGSRKSEDGHPYKVTRVLNSALKEISLEKAFKHYQIFDHKERLISIEGRVEHYLPRILSITYYGRSTKEIKRGIISPLKEKIKKKEKKSSHNHRELGLEETLILAKKLLPMLSDFRAEDRNEWMTIGWTLYSITDGHLDGLDLWCEFSSRCEEKYDESACVYEWERMIKKDYTIGTLRHFASIDSPEAYKKFKDENTKKRLDDSLEGSHYDVAKALFEMYGDQFKCASVTNKIWYQFINHVWEQIEDGVFLREKISEKIVQKYVEAEKKLCDDFGSEQDKGKQAMISVRKKQITKMIQNLKSSPYKLNIMREACDAFYDPRFKEKLDMNPYLIAFKNGVYDLQLNIFRHGRPDDCLSKQMPINYINFSPSDEKVEEVQTFLSQVFPNKHIRKYFLDTSSDVFVGGNHEKLALFWLGEGDNGKSITQNFFEKMMGKLAIKLNTNIITGKKIATGVANPDLARAGGGVRWAVLEEPNTTERIQSGPLKHLTGNDSFYARDLFEKGKDGREVLPLFKLIVIANKLPHIEGADIAVWNRVRVIPFQATFCRPNNPAPESYDEQVRQMRFPMDKQFGKKIPDLVEAFAWVLLDHRKKITKREEPSEVMSATDSYRLHNDFYRQFLEENIVEDSTKRIFLKDLYEIFKNWFKGSQPNQTIPVKNEVEEYFTKLWGTPAVGKIWKGYRPRSTQDDVDDTRAGDMVKLTAEEFVHYDDVKPNPMLED